MLETRSFRGGRISSPLDFLTASQFADGGTRLAGRRTGGPAILVLLVGMLLIGGCGDDSSEPTQDLAEMAGTYNLTQLSFDPQGVLPQTDLLAALGTTPKLVVTVDKAAQILYEDPASGLFTTIQATVRSTNAGLRVDFSNRSAYSGLLLSRQMEFTYTPGTQSLTFDDEAPDGVSRQRLLQLVPAWASEQLLDPVPGRLRVTFRKQ